MAREERKRASEVEVDIVKAQRSEDSVFVFVPKPVREKVGGVEPGDRLKVIVERREGGKIRFAYEKVDCGESRRYRGADEQVEAGASG